MYRSDLKTAFDRFMNAKQQEQWLQSFIEEQLDNSGGYWTEDCDAMMNPKQRETHNQNKI